MSSEDSHRLEHDRVDVDVEKRGGDTGETAKHETFGSETEGQNLEGIKTLTDRGERDGIESVELEHNK